MTLKDGRDRFKNFSTGEIVFVSHPERAWLDTDVDSGNLGIGYQLHGFNPQRY